MKHVYQDNMDPSRFIKPVSPPGNSVKVRVYWSEKGGTEENPLPTDLQFGGFTHLPGYLIGDESRIGFSRVA